MIALKDLDPRWLSEAGRVGQALHFLCPACRNGVCRLCVYFANPVDGGAPYPVDKTPGTTHRWQRTGATFEDLTIFPSIDCPEMDGSGNKTGTHWHGWVEGGQVRNHDEPR